MATGTGRKRRRSARNESSSSFAPSSTAPGSHAVRQASVALQGALSYSNGYAEVSATMDSGVGGESNDPFQSQFNSAYGLQHLFDHMNAAGNETGMPLSDSSAPSNPGSTYAEADADNLIRLLKDAMDEDSTEKNGPDSNSLAVTGIFANEANDQLAAYSDIQQSPTRSQRAAINLNSSSAGGAVNPNFGPSIIADRLNPSPQSGTVLTPIASSQTFQAQHQARAFETTSNPVNQPSEAPAGDDYEFIDPRLWPPTKDGAIHTRLSGQTMGCTGTHMPGSSQSSPGFQTTATNSPLNGKTFGGPSHPVSAPDRLERNGFPRMDCSQTNSTPVKMSQPRPMNNVTPTPVSRQSSSQLRAQPRPNMAMPNGRVTSLSSPGLPSSTGQNLSQPRLVQKVSLDNDPTSPTLPPAKRARTTATATNVELEHILANIAAKRNNQNNRIYCLPQQYNHSELTAYFNQPNIPSDHKWLGRMYRDPEPPPSRMCQTTGFEYPIPAVTGILAPSGEVEESAEFYRQMLLQVQNERNRSVQPDGQGQLQNQPTAPGTIQALGQRQNSAHCQMAAQAQSQGHGFRQRQAYIHGPAHGLLQGQTSAQSPGGRAAQVQGQGQAGIASRSSVPGQAYAQPSSSGSIQPQSHAQSPAHVLAQRQIHAHSHQSLQGQINGLPNDHSPSRSLTRGHSSGQGTQQGRSSGQSPVQAPQQGQAYAQALSHAQAQVQAQAHGLSHQGHAHGQSPAHGFMPAQNHSQPRSRASTQISVHGQTYAQTPGHGSMQSQGRIPSAGQIRGQTQAPSNMQMSRALASPRTPMAQEQQSTPRLSVANQAGVTPRVSNIAHSTTPTPSPRRTAVNTQNCVQGQVQSYALSPGNGYGHGQQHVFIAGQGMTQTSTRNSSHAQGTTQFHTSVQNAGQLDPRFQTHFQPGATSAFAPFAAGTNVTVLDDFESTTAATLNELNAPLVDFDPSMELSSSPEKEASRLFGRSSMNIGIGIGMDKDMNAANASRVGLGINLDLGTDISNVDPSLYMQMNHMANMNHGTPLGAPRYGFDPSNAPPNARISAPGYGAAAGGADGNPTENHRGGATPSMMGANNFHGHTSKGLQTHGYVNAAADTNAAANTNDGYVDLTTSPTESGSASYPTVSEEDTNATTPGGDENACIIMKGDEPAAPNMEMNMDVKTEENENMNMDTNMTMSMNTGPKLMTTTSNNNTKGAPRARSPVQSGDQEHSYTTNNISNTISTTANAETQASPLEPFPDLDLDLELPPWNPEADLPELPAELDASFMATFDWDKEFGPLLNGAAGDGDSMETGVGMGSGTELDLHAQLDLDALF